MKEDYIPPYNYCNYRCEKCSNIGECSLAAKEVVREAELVVEGKDPKDQRVIFEEIERTFKETAKLLNKIAAREGISLEEDLESYSPSPSPEDFPLVQLAHRFTKSVYSMLEDDIFVAISDEASLRERITDLTWDASIISPKLYRALTSRWEAEEEKGDLQEISLEDSFHSAKVVLKSLDNCLNTLRELLKVTLGEKEKVSQAILLGNNLRSQLYQEFPASR